MTNIATRANETAPLLNGHEYHGAVVHTKQYTLSEIAAAHGRISRVRVLTDNIGAGLIMADVSYIHATLPDGSIVPVRHEDGNTSFVPLNQMKGRMIEWAKAEGVFAKSLGLLDDANWSVLR